MQTEAITCGHCGHEFTIKFAVRPKSTSCPKCKKPAALQKGAQSPEGQQSLPKTSLRIAAGLGEPTEYDRKGKRRSRKLALIFTGIGVYLLLWGITWMTNGAILDKEAQNLGGAYIATPAPFVAIAYRNTTIYEGGIQVGKTRERKIVVWPVFWGGHKAIERVRSLGNATRPTRPNSSFEFKP